jgi:hypothetical protein
LINGDKTDADTLRAGISEVLTVVDAEDSPDAKIGELAAKVGTDEQVEALVEKRLAKRRGLRDQ